MTDLRRGVDQSRLAPLGRRGRPTSARRLQRGNGRTLTLGAKLGAGGEAAVYAVAGERELAAKLYDRPEPQHAAKLRAMLATPPTDPISAQRRVSIAWPTDLVLDQAGAVVGFLMPRIDYATSVPLFRLYNPADRRRASPQFTWRYLLHTARNLAGVVEAVHARGYVVGDLNESNLLVTSTALVTLVDCDSMQVLDPDTWRVFRCPVGKPEYTPPELQGCDFGSVDRAPCHDDFGLAVLIFMLLMEGVHPFAGVWHGSELPPTVEQNIRSGECPYVAGSRLTPPPHAPPFETLPPTVQALVRRCFGDSHRDPAARPTLREWRETLEGVEHDLARCSVNDQHVYSGHLDQCPWCERVSRGIPDSFPQPGEQDPLPAVPTGHASSPAPLPASTSWQSPYSSTPQPNWVPGRDGMLALLAIMAVIWVSLLIWAAATHPSRVPAPTPIILLADDFEDPSSGRLSPSSSDPTHYLRGYVEGEYMIRKVDPAWRQVAVTWVPGRYADSSIEFDVRLVSVAQQQFIAVACHNQETGQASQYRFSLRPETGAFSLQRWDNGSAASLGGWRTDRHIRRGDQVNRVALTCAAGTIAARVNGTQVASVQDRTYSEGSMWIGVGSFADSSGPAEARFDNLTVTQR